MESSARGTDAGGPSAGRGESPLSKLSELGDRLKTMADEKIGPDAGRRLKTVTSEKLKTVGGDRFPSGAADRLRSSTGATGADAAGATAPAPPFEERPELYVGAAFAGGLALAGVIRLLAR